MKLDPSGNIISRKYYICDPSSFSQTSDNGYILVGYTDRDISDFWVMKLDSSLNIEWAKAYGDQGFTEYGRDIVQTPDGGFIVVGPARDLSDPLGKYKGWALKLDIYGYIEWQKLFYNENRKQEKKQRLMRINPYLV